MVKRKKSLTPKKIYDLALESFVKMECPDYSDVDEFDVYNAFRGVWTSDKADEAWLTEFIEKLRIMSHGQVYLRKVSPDMFKLQVLGPAEYLELVGNGQKRLLTIGPYSIPITFEEYA